MRVSFREFNPLVNNNFCICLCLFVVLLNTYLYVHLVVCFVACLVIHLIVCCLVHLVVDHSTFLDAFLVVLLVSRPFSCLSAVFNIASWLPPSMLDDVVPLLSLLLDEVLRYFAMLFRVVMTLVDCGVSAWLLVLDPEAR